MTDFCDIFLCLFSQSGDHKESFDGHNYSLKKGVRYDKCWVSSVAKFACSALFAV